MCLAKMCKILYFLKIGLPEPIGFYFNKVKVLPIRAEQEPFQESQIISTDFFFILYITLAFSPVTNFSACQGSQICPS